jgi:hypothetical protein
MLDNVGNGPTFPPDPSPFGPAAPSGVELMSQEATALHD